MSNRKLTLILLFMFTMLCPMFIYSSVIYTEQNTNIFNPDVAVSLEEGNSGTSLIGINGTSVAVNASAANTHNFVDLSTSNVDSSPNKGEHSSFSAQQAGPDLLYDTLAEAETVGYTLNDWADSNTSNIDGHTGHGMSSNFATQQTTDSINDTLTEENTNPSVAAAIFYRDSTTSLNTPKQRVWTTSWGAQTELPTSGSPVRGVRTTYSPIRTDESITVTLSDDGYLDAYFFNGTSWSVTNNIGQLWTSAPSDARRPYDVAYESQSGDALLVYGTTVAGGANDLAYRTWTQSSGWSTEQYYDDVGHSSKVTVTCVALASDLNSDKIGMAYIENTNNDANAVEWNGSSWGSSIEITGSVAIATEECIAIASESGTGAFMAVAGEGQFIKWTRFTTSWSNVGVFDINSGATSVMNWLKLASSQDNRLLLTSVDAASDLCTALWDRNSIGNRQWSTAASSMGSMTATTSVSAMRFTAQASNSVTNILVYIQTATASPAYRFGIETSAATYLPSGTYLGGASNYAVYTPTTTGWLNLTLPSTAPLTAGTVYHLTVRYDSGTISASNFTALRRMGTVANMFRPKENMIDPWLNTISGTTIQNYEPLFVLKYSDNTFESNPCDTATIRNIYSAYWFSEKWTQNADQTIMGVNIPLVKAGTPLGSLFIVLRDETNSQDLATITIPQSEVTTTLQWYEKYFISPITLQSGRVYSLILKSPSSTTSGNSIRCYSLSTGQSGDLTYDGTNSFYRSSTNSGSTWTNADTGDLTYILLSDAGTSGWVVHTPRDTGVDTNAQRCADFAWEYNLAPAPKNQGLLVYGTTAGQITWRIFKAPNYLTAATNVAMGANVHPWVQLKSNHIAASGNIKILGAALEGTVFNLGAISWDGTSFAVIGASTVSSGTTSIAYECFEIKYYMSSIANYEFDYEIQWINANYTSENAQLCIRTGSLGVETLGVDIYSGSSWINIIPSLSPNGWNNVSVSTYLTGNTITFRYKGGTESNDIVETTWLIESALLYTWTNSNYQIDLEEQWDNIDYSGANEILCIYLSSYVGSESIKVDVWYNSAWQNLLTDLSVGWNNVSVSTYLISSTFTIRFSGSNEIADSTQDSWSLDATLLNIWTETYDYILSAASKKGYDQNITLTLYNYSNINRLNNCTIWLHDGTQSVQIIITNGVITQSSGENYALPVGSSRYIAAYVQQSSPGTSTLSIRLEAKTQNSIIYVCLIELRVT